MDKLVCMRVFVNTVKLGSMAKAAKELNVTPPSISKTISKLENNLGIQLIVRTTRKNYLTEEGQIYFDSCERILNEIDDTHRALSHDIKECKGLIKINAPVSFSQHVLYQAVHEYQLENENINFCIQCNDEKVNLVDSSFDLSIRIAASLDDSSARARLISKTKLRLCASREYLKREGSPETPEDINIHNCITYRHYKQGCNRWHSRWHDEEHYLDISGNVTVNNGDVAVQLALCGSGLILQPDFIVQPYLDAGELIEVLPELTWPTLNIYLVYPNTKHVSGRIRSFINFLARYFEDENSLSMTTNLNQPTCALIS